MLNDSVNQCTCNCLFVNVLNNQYVTVVSMRVRDKLVGITSSLILNMWFHFLRCIIFIEYITTHLCLLLLNQ